MKKRSVLILACLLMMGIMFSGCSSESKELGFTVEEYTQRLNEAVKGTDDKNITLEEDDIIINEEEDPLATYMFTDNTGILYKENEMDIVISDVDVALLGDESTYNLVRIFIGTVDDSLSLGDRENILQELGFNTEPIDTNENEVFNLAQTDNYKFTYMYNGETKSRVIKVETK